LREGESPLAKAGFKNSVVPKHFQELRPQFPGTDSENKTTTQKKPPKNQIETNDAYEYTNRNLN